MAKTTVSPPEHVSLGEFGDGAILCPNPNKKNSGHPSVSNDGNRFLFGTNCNGVVNVPGVGNTRHIYVRDISAGTVELLTADVDGVPANGTTEWGMISGDGGSAVFWRNSTNILKNASGNNYLSNQPNVFLKDFVSGSLTLVSRKNASGREPNGASARPRVSDFGTHVVFESLADDLWLTGAASPSPGSLQENIFVFDAATQQSTWITEPDSDPDPNGDSTFGDISADAQYVAFQSTASNLMPLPLNNGTNTQVFTRDALAQTDVQLISHAVNNPARAADDIAVHPAISDDGSYVAYTSLATNLVSDGSGITTAQIYAWNRATNTNVLISREANGTPSADINHRARISGDGRFIVFLRNPISAPEVECQDVFLHDRDADGNGVFDETGGTSTTLVSPTPSATMYDIERTAGLADVTSSGSYVLFSTDSDEAAMGSAVTENCLPSGGPDCECKSGRDIYRVAITAP